MIDPKMLELTSYHGIPHLLHPVITDARRSSDVLDWAVERMEQRYQLLSEKGVRNIEGYNERLAKELGAQDEPAPDQPLSDLEAQQPGDAGGDDLLPEQGRLPYLIIVIDEMADLMILAGKQIEETITRLAQMARAAGIHLLLATQRPSVDVLTGIIKANLPTRISFQVSSRTDSRTILDTIGAEKLLGQGDMLFLPPGTSKVRRIHGAYVSEPEIERVVEYLKRYGKPRYVKIPFRTKKTKEEEETFDYDEKYDLAVQIITDTRQASISMLQRKLRVGYNRAARMIERMEQEGIVGPQEGVKLREVLVNRLD
jgi:S-DNA-T family DNA segregation ATPase FtsK/SpoIIIE